MAAITAASCALAIAANAQETFPISAVVDKFKSDIREVQARDAGSPCRLAIEEVTFRFLAATRLSGEGGVGVDFEILGLGAGGEISQAAARHAASTIELTLKPDEAGGGRVEVSGDPIDLVALILKVKDEIKRANQSEPKFKFDDIQIEQSFKLTRTSSGGVRFVAVEADAGEEAENSHIMTLNLSLPEDQQC